MMISSSTMYIIRGTCVENNHTMTNIIERMGVFFEYSKNHEGFPLVWSLKKESIILVGGLRHCSLFLFFCLIYDTGFVYVCLRI